MDQETRAALLAQLLGISNATQLKLIEQYSNFQALLGADYPEAREVKELSDFIKHPESWWCKTDTLLEQCVSRDIQLLTITREDYPRLLREISSPPPLLFYQGNRTLLELPQIAIVGSRQATVSGLNHAEMFARELAASGITITSGLAAGIDAAAHRGAIRTGKTIAVMGTGLDLVYPKRHSQLRQQILDAEGALVSEFLPGTPPQAKNFPRRNRIISGLSMGVLVIEAAVKSGSLISARYALQQGREVFALPGSIHNPQSRGCHQLIREGATLVETTDQIMAELGGFIALKSQQLAPAGSVTSQPEISEIERCVLNALGFDPMDIDTLVFRSALPITQINQALLNLELAGQVALQDGRITRLA